MNMIPNPQMKDVMKHDFSNVPQVDIMRSTFNRSHDVKMMYDSGKIYPFCCDEVIPGDTINAKVQGITRLTTPLLPFMDSLWLDIFWFFVPNRLLWTNWVKMMGEQENPGDSIDYTVPTVTANFTESELYDYFGIPTGIAGLTVNNLHGRAMNKIWNEWFRDQNLQDSVTVDTDDGPDNVADYVLLPRNKRHDYFTSCLPWPQKTGTGGGAAITLPLGTQAPVASDITSGDYSIYSTNASAYQKLSASTTYVAQTGAAGTSGNSLYADLTSAAAATINDIREAFQLQKILEVSARSGTRYPEIIRGFFGVTSPDHRVQRSEYLGGGSTRIYVQPIANTSEDATNPQGHLTAVAYANTKGCGFTKSFTEHGVILGLLSIRSQLSYSQGIDKMWKRQTRYDYYVPQTAHLGEVEVLNEEIWCDGSANDDLVFGYQEIWAEMRYKKSLILGQLRSDHSSSLDVWHLSQDFATLPSLDNDFIVEAPPISRIVAVPSQPEFTSQFYIQYYHTRPMPVFSVPGLVDHF